MADAGASADAPCDTGSFHSPADGQPEPCRAGDEQQVQQPDKKRGRRAGALAPWVRTRLARGGLHIANMTVSSLSDRALPG